MSAQELHPAECIFEMMILGGFYYNGTEHNIDLNTKEHTGIYFFGDGAVNGIDSGWFALIVFCVNSRVLQLAFQPEKSSCKYRMMRPNGAWSSWKDV